MRKFWGAVTGVSTVRVTGVADGIGGLTCTRGVAVGGVGAVVRTIDAGGGLILVSGRGVSRRTTRSGAGVGVRTVISRGCGWGVAGALLRTVNMFFSGVGLMVVGGRICTGCAGDVTGLMLVTAGGGGVRISDGFAMVMRGAGGVGAGVRVVVLRQTMSRGFVSRTSC
jgi:hypothetical protein